MWPFKRKRTVKVQEISFTQLDITEGFSDNEKFGSDEWVATIPLRAAVEDAEAHGWPAVTASHEEVYELANRLSGIRESFKLPDDGVYCPVCHIANTDQNRLRTPCPKCGRPLLKFGWD